MREDLHITPALITRRYDQGLNSIIRLVTDLTVHIEDLSVLHVGKPQRTIRAQASDLKRLKKTIANKDVELVEAHQLNRQLQMRVRELEKSLETDVPATTTAQAITIINRDSHNSNQPPSLDLPWTKPKRTRSLRKQSGLKVGGQVGHEGATLRQVAVPNRVVVHQVDECQGCGALLAAVNAINLHKRQVFEIENGALAVIEHRLTAKTCPSCSSVSKGQFPLAVKAPVQYGTSVLSRAVYLHLYQLLPVARTQEAMRDLFGCDISQASIQRAVRLCSDKLVRCEQRIKAALRDSTVIGADETGIRLGGATAWVHVARTDTLTHLATHTHRGQPAFNAIGILNQFKGTLVRDGFASYQWYRQCRHGLCNAHLLRNLTFVGEDNPAHRAWTTAMAKMLIEIKEAVEAARSQLQMELEKSLRNNFLDRYDVILADAEHLLRGSPEKKTEQLNARNLHRRLVKSKAEVLLFMTDFAVPFDNNGSERDLRMLKLQQKIAGCFRTATGVQTFCRVRSYLSSAIKQGRGLLAALEHALKGKPIALTN